LRDEILDRNTSRRLAFQPTLVDVSVATPPSWVPLALFPLYSRLAAVFRPDTKPVSIKLPAEQISLGYYAQATEAAISAAQDGIAALTTSIAKGESPAPQAGQLTPENQIEELKSFLTHSVSGNGYSFSNSSFEFKEMSVKFQCDAQDIPYVRLLLREWVLHYGPTFPTSDELAYRSTVTRKAALLPEVIKASHVLQSAIQWQGIGKRTLREFSAEPLLKLAPKFKLLGISSFAPYESSSYPSWALEILLSKDDTPVRALEKLEKTLIEKTSHFDLSPLEKALNSALAQLDADLLTSVQDKFLVSSPIALPVEVQLAVIDSLNRADTNAFLRDIADGKIIPSERYEAPRPEDRKEKKTYAEVIASLNAKPRVSEPHVVSAEFLKVWTSVQRDYPLAPFMEVLASSKPKTALSLLRLNCLFPEMSGIEKSQSFLKHTDGDLASFWYEVYRLSFIPNDESLPFVRASLRNGNLFTFARQLRADDISFFTYAALLEHMAKKVTVPPKKGADSPKESKKDLNKPIGDAKGKSVSADTVTCEGKSYSRKDLSNRLRQAQQAGKESIVIGQSLFTLGFLSRLLANPLTKVLYSRQKSDGSAKPPKGARPPIVTRS